MVKVLQRMLRSRKNVLATIVLLADAIAVWGFDVPTEQITQGAIGVFNGLGALLIAGQSIIDAVHGSPSDNAGS